MKETIHKGVCEFERWMEAVDDFVSASICLSIQDLPDYGYRDAYDSGMSAEETAAEIIDDFFNEVFV